MSTHRATKGGLTQRARVGWRHKAYAGAHRVVAYPPKHKQIDSSTLYARKIAVFGGLAISMFGQGEIL